MDCIYFTSALQFIAVCYGGGALVGFHLLVNGRPRRRQLRNNRVVTFSRLTTRTQLTTTQIAQILLLLFNLGQTNTTHVKPFIAPTTITLHPFYIVAFKLK